MNLYYNFDARYLCDVAGDPIQDLPELAFAEQPVWKVFPIHADGAAVDLSEITTFRAAVDADFKAETNVMCRTLPEDITVADGGIIIPLDCQTSRFYDIVNGAETRAAYFELSGFAKNGKRVFYLIFRISARMILDPEDTQTLPDPADLFADRAYVMSLFRAGYEIQFSQNSVDWTDTQSGAEYFRYRNRLAGGEWSDAVPLIHGESLIPDAIGLISERPQTASENYKYLAADEGRIYFYRGGEWVSSAIGPTGSPGRSILTVEFDSSENLEKIYKIKYSDNTESFFTVSDGEAGKDLDWDVVGPYEALSDYDAAPAGFRYAATVEDSEAKTNTIYIWKKASDNYADWLNPLVLVRYSIAGRNASLIEPLEFSAPTAGQDTLTLSLSQYNAATIAAVCIDTDAGELRLPYGSSNGVLSIIKNKTQKSVAIRFGEGVPQYETGRVYFAQGVAYDVNIPDAPADGKIYARKEGAWVEVISGGGGGGSCDCGEKIEQIESELTSLSEAIGTFETEANTILGS